MRTITTAILVILLVACVAPRSPLEGIDIPDPENEHLFHPFIKGVGVVKWKQTEKLGEARLQLEEVIQKDTEIKYPEAYPYLVECYRLLEIPDSAKWVYETALQRLEAMPAPADTLVENMNTWAGFFPELPDSFKEPGFMVMDSPVEPMGGMMSLYRRLEYPEMAKSMNRTGTTYLSLVVEANGSVTGLQVIKSSYPDLDEEALKVVRNSTWVPAKYNGYPVPYQLILPIKFRL